MSIISNYNIDNNTLVRVKEKSKSFAVVISKAMREQTLIACHDDVRHMDAKKTLHNLKQRYWWPNMRKDCKNYVRSCHKCQVVNRCTANAYGLLQQLLISTTPWEIVSADHVICLPQTRAGNTNMLVHIDHATRYVVATPSASLGALSVTDALYHNIILRYGPPNDNPRENQLDLLILARAEAANNVYEAHLENKHRFDLHRRSHSFKAGDLILYDWPKQGDHKLSPIFKEPFVIVRPDRAVVRQKSTRDLWLNLMTSSQTPEISRISHNTAGTEIANRLTHNGMTPKNSTCHGIQNRISKVAFKARDLNELAGHFARMNENRCCKKVFLAKPMGNRPLDRPLLRWTDCVKKDNIKVKNWKTVAKSRDAWRTFLKGCRTNEEEKKWCSVETKQSMFRKAKR
ncbi:hypothetical protein TNCV_155271 [Trichonephila clavipes]|uniref:RNA-directed DNA polymerase n=1 Tax=Trichonephila clavipes TaxID=2585209 RepID=A0A8X7BLT4_TRICX|nr:hypothetical protein TNCV_155271 [Trichonephila clavipes]